MNQGWVWEGRPPRRVHWETKRWGTFGLAAAGLWLTQACSELPPCEEPMEFLASVPSGTFAPAVTNRVVQVDGELLFEGSFPRGALDPSVDADPEDITPGGTAVPSARLEIDRPGLSLVRSYIDDQGRLVEETWRMQAVEP